MSSNTEKASKEATLLSLFLSIQNVVLGIKALPYVQKVVMGKNIPSI
jgi:hypothetical protein